MNNRLNTLFRVVAIIVLLMFAVSNLKSENLKALVDLSGTWKFSIGDNPAWSNPNFDHEQWDNVIVPRSWEANGFKGYNGYAWYRKTFTWNQTLKEDFVLLCLGRIDDADEVFVNGVKVGSMGGMQENQETAYEVNRKYAIPIHLLNKGGLNVISVRVYDFHMDGGIVDGKIGLYIDQESEYLALNLAGYWLFETEKELKQRQTDNTPYKVKQLFVPGYWESQGYFGYNGKAIYKKSFNVPYNISDEQLYVVLGFIDDVEVVYLNSEKIGSVIAYEKKERTGLPYHQIFRTYPIPKYLFKKGEENIITVVVHDNVGLGGIYEGPIGIATEANSKILKELNKIERTNWEIFFNSFNR